MRKDRVVGSTEAPHPATSEPRKFKCPVENAEFPTFAELQAHFVFRHGQDVTKKSSKKFICPYDGLPFATLNALKLMSPENIRRAWE